MPHHGLRVFPSLSQPSPCSELMLNSATQQVMANCSKTAVLELGRGWMAHKRGFCLILLAAFFLFYFFLYQGDITQHHLQRWEQSRTKRKRQGNLTTLRCSRKLLHLHTAHKEAPGGAGFGIISHYLCCCTRSPQLAANRAPVFNAEVVLCDLSNLPHQRKAEEPGEGLNC